MSAAHHGTLRQVQIPPLDVARHTKYFLRCLKTPLPVHYIPTDSNRMALAFYTISGLDLLGALDANLNPAERQGHIDWVYLTQHPNGGFRGFTGGCGSRSPSETGPDASPDWDPATLSATFFALCILLILDDDLSRVDRAKCAAWLPRLQFPDGGFGDALVGNEIHGGHDARFGYCAAGVSYILGLHLDTASTDGDGRGGHHPSPRSIDRDAFVRSVRATETYDGGIAGRPGQEAHAGFTYCAIAGLKLFGRLPDPGARSGGTTSREASIEVSGLGDRARTVHWLAARLTSDIYKTTDLDDDDDGDGDDTDEDDGTGASPASVGYNGRTNKLADTCYAFWTTGAQAVLSGVGNSSDEARAALSPPTLQPVLRWLLGETRNAMMGGFGKHAGDLPDLHHSYLGLATLGLLGPGCFLDPDRGPDGIGGGNGDGNGNGDGDGGGLGRGHGHGYHGPDWSRPLDAALCISVRASERIAGIWRRTWALDCEL